MRTINSELMAVNPTLRNNAAHIIIHFMGSFSEPDKMRYLQENY
jgi:hypothetical protein